MKFRPEICIYIFLFNLAPKNVSIKSMSLLRFLWMLDFLFLTEICCSTERNKSIFVKYRACSLDQKYWHQYQ